MLGIHRWLRAGLIFTLAGALGACNSRVPDAPEPLNLINPINVAESGQAVRFEFETNARNFHPGRTYALELELQRQETRKPDEPDVGTMRIPFKVTLQRWDADAWKDVPTYDSYQAGVLNAGEQLPEWHASSEWRYTSPHMGSDGQYTLSLVALPMEIDSRYRVDVRTVQRTEALQGYSARFRIHAARPAGK
ncbi:hypothetical protein ROV96_18510 [Stenotrophomonas pavanii]|uniref:hypothetical protein n=1 Tax=Stenotrophomonas pavanii TaxID=487698 RepID=UPI002893F7E8|nr:hypothetical protein [Stenotrophomonas pavanii]MDT3457216.1 hypothetical protein [Stenotrophomonas pavanii]MDT3465934.1 hypothetical protein [Stenotrophomonas pavanii]